MAGETITTIIGNLTGDPELRFTPSGDPVANFTIASTPRTFDRQSNEWKDGETLFMPCSLWREAAENAAESFVKGTRVIAQGAVKMRKFETKEGEKRTVVEMEVQEIGPSIKSATAKVTKVQKNQQGGGQYGNQQAPQQGQGGFPAQQGQAPQQGGFPGQQGGFPQGPPMQGGFPQQGGYPQAPQQGGYPQPGGYPQQ